MTSSRGLFTPAAPLPKESNKRNKAAMAAVLKLVDLAILLYNKAVLRARHFQARLVVDALCGRYVYQLQRGNTVLTFGEWLLAKGGLHNSYARMGPEEVMYIFAGIVADAKTDKRFRLFGHQEWVTDWLTPLIEEFINHRVEEDWYRIKVKAFTVPSNGYAESMPSLKFERILVPGKHAPH